MKGKKKRKGNLCNFCPPELRGICCHYETSVKDVRIVTDYYCKFLDPETGKCTVYKERFQKNPDCLTLEEMKERGTLPKKCPYVQFNEEYKSRTDLRLYFDEFEIIKKEIE